ncbi:MAG: hypothetical protein KJ956_02330, partial [Actinobacteria bacterium]|nr:hypothetical protein [Actinomycetota bacterium]
MALDFFSPEAQQALDLAKRVVGDDGELTAGLLMAAAYAIGEMSDGLPELAAYLPEPKTRRRAVPEAVTVAADLRPVFEFLSRDDFVTLDELMAAVVESDSGRSYLIGAGMPIGDFERVKDIVKGNALPSGDAPVMAETGWRASPERAEVLEALSSFGRMLTEGTPPHKSVVEMDTEMCRLQKTLLKMKRRNLIVTGQPGTGKTALVYEFARRLLIGDPSIDPRLRSR